VSPTKTKASPPRPAVGVTAPEAAGVPMPTLTPEGMAAAAPATGPGMPTLTPPGNGAGVMASAQATVEAVGAVQSVTIGGLWTSNNQSNAYAYLNGIGWRHISAANPVAHHAMLQILRLARDGNLTAQCDEDGTNIHTVYVW
jgi:hypothetical protein